MKKRIINKSLCVLLLLGLFLNSFAQDNKLDGSVGEFSKNAEAWGISDTSYFSISDYNSLKGDYALKYEFDNSGSVNFPESHLSIETGYTIRYVRTASNQGKEYIVASSYEGTVLAISFDGVVLWENKLSGFMNRDLWAADLNNDGKDEILAANADGSIYCLNDLGGLKWQFKKNTAPMNAVCVVEKDNTPYVIAGGYDRSIYYIDAKGNEVEELKSSSYSQEFMWGDFRGAPSEHTSNFIRPIRKSDGSVGFVVHSAIHTSSSPGHLYFFDVLATEAYHVHKLETSGNLGSMNIVDSDKDGNDEVILGTSGLTSKETYHYNPVTKTGVSNDLTHLWRDLRFGYRVAKGVTIPDGNSYKYLTVIGHLAIIGTQANSGITSEVITGKYSYNDIWQLSDTKIILGSAQTGGSCVHILDLADPDWKEWFSNLEPPGKMAAIWEDYEKTRTQLETFQKPGWEHEPPLVHMHDETRTGIEDLIDDYLQNKTTPLFYNSKYSGYGEDWDRSGMANEKYKNMRDGRHKYEWTQQQALDFYYSLLEAPGEKAMTYKAGHGTDPYYFSLETNSKIINHAKVNNRQLLLTFTELESHDANAAWMMDDFFYPLADSCQKNGALIYLRNKHTFWNSIVHKPLWDEFISGKYANTIVISMEETNSKAMDISLPSRMGLWMSGSTDIWGCRGSRDNPCYDRLRQVSHQMIPNHFLRQTIHRLASGSTSSSNFEVNQGYFSIIYDLISSGAIYIPKREELISISPVHISMVNPDEEWIDKTNHVKFTVGYDEEFEEDNKWIISRLSGEWPGAPLTEWDYSRYAAGSKERRLEFLPNFENGMVLFTPPQTGPNADNSAPRGKMVDNMHPLYKNNLKEYFSDGVNYYSADGSETYPADTYYETIENQIKESSKLLPLTVKGRVAWAAAQTAPKHIRLTIVDGGYVNPDEREAVVTFNTVTPVAIKDVMSGETINILNPSKVTIDIPCGGFRFLDIEIANEL